jgi:putative ATPase
LSGIYFKRFTKKDLESLLERAMKTDRYLSTKNIVLSETEALLRLSGGDGRKLLNIFELVVNASNEDEILITNDLVFPSATKYGFI